MVKKFLNKIQSLQVISFSLVVAINFIFAYKYFSRSIEHGLILSVGYSLFLIFSYLFIKKLKSNWIDSTWFYYSLVFIYCLVLIVIFQIVKVESLNVDRWSVIASFWEQSFKGQYPYNATSHMGNYPGPLPFYFILALPFHLLGEIGYLSLLGIIAFAIFIRKNLSARESVGALIILFLSVSVFWELLVRSTILINSILFLIYLFWLQRINFSDKKQYLISAILGGLLLSTRTIFLLALVIHSVFLLKNKEVKLTGLTGWLLIIIAVLTLTFLPLLLFYFDEFLIRNPFSVQSDSLLPFRISFVFLILAIISGFICSQKTQTTLYTTGLFVLIFITYSIFIGYKNGFEEVYLNSKVDISYLLFAFPFLVYYSFDNSYSLKK